jgi:hypothetical protein
VGYCVGCVVGCIQCGWVRVCVVILRVVYGVCFSECMRAYVGRAVLYFAVSCRVWLYCVVLCCVVLCCVFQWYDVGMFYCCVM